MNEEIPIVARCLFEFVTTRHGKEYEKGLRFELYLENLEAPSAELLFYPWKVKNVEYEALAKQQQTDASGRPKRVVVTVRVPSADADVWFDSHRTNQRGTERVFESGALEPGSYAYEIRARWRQNGKDVEQTRTIRVQPGQPALLDFTRPKTE